MELRIEDDVLIRRYLLGQLSEDEREHVEKRLMTDNELYDRVLLAEDEMVEEYLQGKLPERDRQAFEASYLATADGREQLSFEQGLRKYVSTRAAAQGLAKVIRARRLAWWKQTLFGSYARMAATAIVVLGVGFGIWRIFFYQAEVSRGMAALAYAYREERPTEARITEFNYAPPRPATRGAEQDKFDYVARDRAQTLILVEASEHPSVRSLHDLGRLYLAEREFDKAIDQFDKALKLDEKNAQLHSDYGAAYLERAIAEENKPNLGDLAKGLEQFNRALEIQDSLLAALFNKALCLQRMKTAPATAIEAWETYLQKDPDSQWSKEAEKNLVLLRGRASNQKPSQDVLAEFLACYRERNEVRAAWIQSQTKEMIAGTMVPFVLAQSFLMANLSNQTQASDEILEALKFAARVDEKQSGDPFFVELAAYYSADGRRNAVTLKQAQEALQKGYEFCLQGGYDDARPRFENAHRLFVLAGDGWEAKVVEYWLAYCDCQLGELEKSTDLLLALAEDCGNRGYRWLEAQSYGWLANNSALLGEYSRGMEQDNKAFSIATAIGDSYLTQKISSQLAEDYKFFGRPTVALEFNERSLPSAESYYASYRQLWRSLDSITDTLFALRLYAAAEAFEREALQLATNQLKDPVLTHNTYVRLGQIYGGQRNYQAALVSVRSSLDALTALRDDRARQKLFGESVFQMGNINRQAGHRSTALNYYRDAAKTFDTTEYGLYGYAAHKGMLLCYLLDKDDAGVGRELPMVLDLFEQNRQKIKEEQNRNHFFDTEQNVYDLAIDYQYDRGNLERSFYYVELSRARSLLSALIQGAKSLDDPDVSAVSQPFTLAELAARLSPEAQLVEYAVLEDRLLIWMISRSRVEVIERPTPAALIESSTNEYLHALMGRDAGSVERERQLAAQLHELLFAPIEGFLNKDQEVAIVPDKMLFKVPFGALVTREGSRVINDYTLLYAPSATVMVVCSEQAAAKDRNRENERVLSVGNPAFNESEHRDLRALHSAEFEAQQIASFYRTKAIFTGAEASKERIGSEMRQADVIHFATHYLPDDFSSRNSRLLLSAVADKKESGDTGDLSLEEIQSMLLPRAKLAILSACRSGIERYYAGEGVVGLSRAFMVAGVPLVVASLWEIETDSASNLMVDFHRIRKTENLSTVQALRRAQIDMLNSEDERYRQPYYWAAFFPIGGHASY
jgi:CHAT domain-containing protein